MCLAEDGEGGEQMGRGERGHVVELGGGDDLLQGGVQVGLWGPWGKQWGLWMSPDVRAYVGWTGGVGCPGMWPIRWQHRRRRCGNSCGGLGFHCGLQ